MLAGAGEFAFVVFTLARGADLISAGVLEAAITVAALSMLATPLVAAGGRRIALRLAAQADSRDHGVGDGAGVPRSRHHRRLRPGRRDGGARARRRADPLRGARSQRRRAWRVQRADGRPVFYGDASRREILERVGGAAARAFVVTPDAPAAAERMVHGDPRRLAGCRHPCPRARRRSRPPATDVGASNVVPEALEGSLQLAGRVLAGVGLPDEAVDTRLAVQREAEIRRLAGRRPRRASAGWRRTRHGISCAVAFLRGWTA